MQLVRQALHDVDLPMAEVDLISKRLTQSNVIDDHLFSTLTSEDPDLLIMLFVLTGIVSDPEIPERNVAILFSQVETHFDELSELGEGIYWHLTGHLLWREDRAFYQALHHLNNSLAALDGAEDARANPYLARVHDSLGQLSYNMGHIQDALLHFQAAIDLRPKEADDFGKAITFGNLGRAHMDLGNWGEAIKFFGLDLQIVRNHFNHLTRIQTQLLSHLGNCHLEDGDLQEAKNQYEKGRDLALRDENDLGQIHCMIGLGKVAVLSERLEEAMHWRNQVVLLLEEQAPTSAHQDLMAHHSHLSGLICSANGDLPQAHQYFTEALQLIRQSGHTSAIELAGFLLDSSKCSSALGDRDTTADLLAEALTQLDSTSAVARRVQVEAQLKAQFRDRWILHTSRRLSGGRSFESLLDRTGAEGFSVEKKQVAVLFADIRGFTKISEGMDPEDLIRLLNDYLSSMIRSVSFYEGYVVHVLGDAVMAVFTLPESHADDADRALLAAMTMLEENRRLNALNSGKYAPLKMGVGLHFGEAVTGLIGSALKRSYTLIGDVVNISSRLEGLTKVLGVPVLVSDAFSRSVRKREDYMLLPLGNFVLYGREEAISVLAVLGKKDHNPRVAKFQEQIEKANAALEQFRAGLFKKAAALFLELRQDTGITGFQYLADRARHFESHPPDDGWSGAIELETK